MTTTMKKLLLGALAGGVGCSAGSSPTDLGASADLVTRADLAANGDAASDAATADTTLTTVYITWYGFNDNSCQIETQHDCNTIAFPKSDGWSVPHDIATDGAGTYADPNTFATAAADDGSNAELAPGTIIYVPSVRKYFIMEDQCAECGTDWAGSHSYHVDLWMGPSYGSDNIALTSCEDKLTIGDTNAGTGTIIVDPSPTLTVDTTPLFMIDLCTAHQY